MKKRQHLLAVLLLPLLASCGDSRSNSAGLTFAVAIEQTGGSAKTVTAAATDICAEYDIGTITATLTDTAGTQKATGNWDCGAHTGSFGSLPSGSGYTLTLTGLSGSTTAWQGSRSGITLSGNSISDADTVTLNYVAAYTQAILTLAVTGSGTSPVISYGATIGIPVGVSITAGSDGSPSTGVLNKASSITSTPLINGKYTAPTSSAAGSLVLGVTEGVTGFGTAPLLTITTSIPSGTVPGASSFPVTSVTGYDADGNAITGIGGSVTIRYQ